MSERLMTITTNPFTDLMHFHVRRDVYRKMSYLHCYMEVAQQDDYFIFYQIE